jgi:hypothetical protein
MRHLNARMVLLRITENQNGLKRFLFFFKIVHQKHFPKNNLETNRRSEPRLMKS